MSNQRFEKQKQFLQNRLSPEGYAGLHLTIGVLVILLAGWWFGAIAEDLSPDNPLVLFDQRVAVWFHQHATTTLTHVAKAITFFGSALGLTILSVAVALVFIVSRAWFNLFVFAFIMTGRSEVDRPRKLPRAIRMRRPILYALRWSYCHVRHDESVLRPKFCVVPENLTALSDQVSDDEWGLEYRQVSNG